jgi:HK97 family phage portal protein
MLDGLKSAFGFKAKQDRLDYVRSTIKPEATYGMSRSTQEQAASLRLMTGYVYAAVMMNARMIAAQPLRLYASVEARGTKQFPTKSVSKSVQRYLKGDGSMRPAKSAMLGSNTGGDVVEIYDHPILDLLNKVSPFYDGYNFNILRKTFLQVTGNEYLHPIMGPMGYPVEIWVMPSQYVKIKPTRDERMIEGYEYGQQPDNAFFAPDEVLHNRVPDPNDPLYGRGWVAAASDAAGLLQQMDGYEKHLFQNQARPDWGIFLKETLNETQWNRMIAYLDQNLRGNHNSGRPYIFEGGSDARPLQFSPRDLSFSEGENRKVEVIAAVSGVPVTLLKANDPNLASAQVGFASYMRDTIHPYLVADAEFLNQSLLPLFGGLADGLFLAYDNPVQEDEQLISGIMQSQVAAGIRTINEARSELGLDPAEDGDELRVNGIPLDVLGQPALPPLGALAYGNEEEENRKATRSEVRVGSWVEWRTEKGKYLGKIRRFKESGTEPGTVGDGEATAEDPIAFVQVYIRNEDGTFTPSDRDAPVQVSRLTPTDEPEVTKGIKAVSEQVRETLKEKAEEHNEEVGDAKSKRTTTRTLVAVFERGIGAYRQNPSSVRPTVAGAEQWAYARVNGFLHALKTGKFKRNPYDTDLLPEGHPLSSKEKGDKAGLENFPDVYTTPEEAESRAEVLGCDGIHEHPGDAYGYDGVIYMPCSSHRDYEAAIKDQQKKYEDIDFTPPADVQEEAQRGLDWRAEHGRGGTEVGVARARDLSNGVSVSPETIRRMVNYFTRHEVDKQGEGFERGEDGYPSAGRIAWALWGGDAGQRWANSIRDRMDAEDERGEKVARREGESLDNCVARGIEVLMAEGYERDQAVAIAYRQCGTATKRAVAFLTGMEPEMQKKAFDGPSKEDWPERTKEARKAIEDVEDYEPEPASEDIRTGEPANPARRIQTNLVRVLEDQKREIINALLGEKGGKKQFGPSDLLNLLTSLGAFEIRYQEAVAGPMAEATASGSTFGTNEVGVAGSFDVVDPKIAEFAATYSDQFASEASAASLRRARTIIARGLEERRSVQEIADQISQDYAFSPERATVVARTETARAFVEGERLGWEESGVVRGKQWQLAAGGCPFCRMTARKGTAKVFALNEPFWKNGDTISAEGKTYSVRYGDVQGAPLHPNCRCDILPVLGDSDE